MRRRHAGAARRALSSFILGLSYFVSPRNGAQASNRTVEKPELFVQNYSHDLHRWVMEAVPSRLWDDVDLRASYAVPMLDQMRPFLAKLEAGHAVTVVAFGDSITQFFGGCFHRDEAHMASVVHTFSPALVEVCSIRSWGFLNIFMEAINKTWPHPDHILINLGMPAHCFSSFAYDVCIEPMTPKGADLIILEHLSYLEPSLLLKPKSLEETLITLLHRLQRRVGTPHRPPVILLNMHRLVDLPYGALVETMAVTNTISLKGLDCVHVNNNSFRDLPNASSDGPDVLAESHRLAAAQGLASLSYLQLLTSIAKRETDVAKPSGPSHCQVFTQLYGDSVHPRPLGALLLGELFITYLSDAIAHINATSAAAPAAVDVAPPEDSNTTSVFRMHCYAVGAGHHSSAAGLHGQEEMRIVKSEGWSVVEIENKKYKPGWVSTEPGSLLWVEVEVGAFLLNKGAVIEITLLHSYEHMGIAALSCVNGCHCSEVREAGSKADGTNVAIIDLHRPDAHYSGPRVGRLEVVRLKDEKCTLQVEVLNKTNSGENKIKVQSAAVKTWVHVPHRGGTRHFTGSESGPHAFRRHTML